MRVLEYIHAALITMLLIPLLYAISEYKSMDSGTVLYMKCLLIMIPIIATEIAIRHIRNLGLYIIVSFAVTAALWMIIRLCFNESGTLYRIVMLAESVFIALIRFRERLRLARQKREDDIYTAPQISLINQPSFGFMWYFTAVYMIGIIFSAKQLCDFAFFNAVIYFFIALAHAYVTSTNKYIGLNRRTNSMPVKRLYTIGAAMTGFFAVLVLIAIIPSFFLAGQRRYTDIRTWFHDVTVEPYVMEYHSQPDAGGFDTDDWIAILNEGEPVKEPSVLWRYLGWLFAAVFVGFVIYEIVKLLRQVFGEFRSSFDENGDKVEALEDALSQKEERLGLRRSRKADSEAERIRRAYRKTIRKHRKELPAPYESPTELEKNAGLSEDEDMKLLHIKYEGVRYGQVFPRHVRPEQERRS